MARPDRSSRNAVTASAAIVDLTKPLEVRRQKNARRDYQDEGLGFYQTMPEIRYPANFTGGQMSQYRLRVALLDENDPSAPPRIPDGNDVPDLVKKARYKLDEVQGPQGGLAAIQNLYGINMAVAGDGWLFGLDVTDAGTPVGSEWEFLSIKELIFESKAGPDGTTVEEVFRDRTGSAEPTKEENRVPLGAYYRRFWKPHPVHSDLADTPMEALGDDCRRLQLLNESIEARLLSRLASNGIFFVPNSITMPVVMEGAEGAEDEKIEDLVIRRIVAYMEASIRSRGSAAAAMPIFMRGPDDVGEKINHIILDSAITETELQLRGETRANIAHGLDLPKEVTEGLDQASHWTSWSAMDSTQTNHTKPGVQRFADGLLRVQLRPALLADFGDAITDEDRAEIRRIVLVADGSDVAAKPNEAEDGRQLADRFAIGPSALRRRSGVASGDAPTDEEYVRMVGAKVNNPWIATYGLEIQKDEKFWEEAAKFAGKAGKPGVGSVPTDRRPADPSDPAGAPGGRGGAGGVRKSAGK